MGLCMAYADHLEIVGSGQSKFFPSHNKMLIPCYFIKDSMCVFIQYITV